MCRQELANKLYLPERGAYSELTAANHVRRSSLNLHLSRCVCALMLTPVDTLKTHLSCSPLGGKDFAGFFFRGKQLRLGCFNLKESDQILMLSGGWFNDAEVSVCVTRSVFETSNKLFTHTWSDTSALCCLIFYLFSGTVLPISCVIYFYTSE